MTDRIRIRNLGDVDGLAMRAGDQTRVIISSAVPAWARSAAAEHLLQVVRSAPGDCAAAGLPVGDATRLAKPAAMGSHWWAIGPAAAAALQWPPEPDVAVAGWLFEEEPTLEWITDPAGLASSDLDSELCELQSSAGVLADMV